MFVRRGRTFFLAFALLGVEKAGIERAWAVGQEVLP